MPKHGDSIWKRKDGRWEARFIKARDDFGKAVYGYVYDRTYAGVKLKRDNQISELKSSAARTESEVMTFFSLIRAFMNQQKYLVKESTYVHYTEMTETHIKPYFGNVPMTKISNAVIERFVEDKLKNGRLDGKGGLSPKTVKDMTVLLKHILTYAIDKKYMADHGLSVVAPKAVKPEIEILTREDQIKLESYTKTSESIFYFGIYLCLYTGLRIGEICALRWSDIDLEKRTLQVNRTIQRIKNTDENRKEKTKIIIERPKTDASVRAIPLPSLLVRELLLRKTGAHDSDYILTCTAKYIEPRNYYARYKHCIECCGIHNYTFHALRHTFATRCIECGFDVKSLSEILGHSDVKITLERYVHPSMDMKRNYMEHLISC